MWAIFQGLGTILYSLIFSRQMSKINVSIHPESVMWRHRLSFSARKTIGYVMGVIPPPHWGLYFNGSAVVHFRATWSLRGDSIQFFTID